jgi:hypothetical protein
MHNTRCASHVNAVYTSCMNTSYLHLFILVLLCVHTLDNAEPEPEELMEIALAEETDPELTEGKP